METPFEPVVVAPNQALFVGVWVVEDVVVVPDVAVAPYRPPPRPPTYVSIGGILLSSSLSLPSGVWPSPQSMTIVRPSSSRLPLSGSRMMGPGYPRLSNSRPATPEGRASQAPLLVKSSYSCSPYRCEHTSLQRHPYREEEGTGLLETSAPS